MLTGEAVELDQSSCLPEPLRTLPRWSRPPLSGSTSLLVHLKQRRRGRGDFLPEVGLTTALSHAGAGCPVLPEGRSTLPRGG